MKINFRFIFLWFKIYLLSSLFGGLVNLVFNLFIYRNHLNLAFYFAIVVGVLSGVLITVGIFSMMGDAINGSIAND